MIGTYRMARKWDFRLFEAILLAWKLGRRLGHNDVITNTWGHPSLTDVSSES